MTKQETHNYLAAVTQALGEGWTLLNADVRWLGGSAWGELQAPDGSRIGATWKQRGEKVRFAGESPNEHYYSRRPPWSCTVKATESPEAVAQAIMTKLWPRWSVWVKEYLVAEGAKMDRHQRERAIATELMSTYLNGRGPGWDTSRHLEVEIHCWSEEPLVIKIHTEGVHVRALKAALKAMGQEMSLQIVTPAEGYTGNFSLTEDKS